MEYFGWGISILEENKGLAIMDKQKQKKLRHIFAGMGNPPCCAQVSPVQCFVCPSSNFPQLISSLPE